MPYRRPELSGSAQALLDAVVAISSDLDLHSVLSRIVETACRLTGATYGAVGVIGADGNLSEFLTHGVDATQREAIGAPPRGRGLLRVLIDHPAPLRMTDLSEHPASYGFPEHHPPMRSFLGVPVRIRGAVFGNLYLTEKTDGDFTESDALLVEALASAAGFVIENARAYTLSERRRQWLQATAELGEVLQPPLEEQEALVRIARQAGAVARARATAVVRVGADPADAADEAVLAASPDEADRLRGEVATLLARVGTNPTGPVQWEEGPLRALVVPVRAHLSEPLLLLTFFAEEHHVLEVEERELLISFADQAALALDRAQALADRAELAVISDRERIARDLHDTVIQRLFATGLHLQGVSMGLGGQPDVVARLDRTVDDLDQVVRDIRGTIFELRHAGEVSLQAQVRVLAREYTPLLGFAPVLRLDGPLDSAVPEPVVEHLLPVLREALSNASRHAQAAEVVVALRTDGTEVELLVEDDGTGPGGDSPHSGLRNARSRAAALGGTSDLLAREPSGSTFSWRVPLPGRPA